MIAAIVDNSTKKTMNARVPNLPTVRGSASETATMSDATINGITVMRIAFTHMVPKGSSHPATRAASLDPDVETAMPSANPSASAARECIAGLVPTVRGFSDGVVSAAASKKGQAPSYLTSRSNRASSTE